MQHTHDTGIVPADLAVSERLFDQHLVVIDALGGLVLPPIQLAQPGLKILEAGTADGHWLFHVREQIGSSNGNKYVGSDINPRFFPKSHPPDCEFRQHSIAEPWPESDYKQYDLVHQRFTLPGAGSASLAQAVSDLFALVKPGGWIQLVEAEQTGPDSGPAFHQFLELVRAVFEKTGAGWKYAGRLREWLENAGAVDVTEREVDLKLGATNEDKVLADKGASSNFGATAGLVYHSKELGVRTSMATEELDSLPARLYDELVRQGCHYPIRVVWGRKEATKL